MKTTAKALHDCCHWSSTTAVLWAIWDFSGCNIPLFPLSP